MIFTQWYPALGTLSSSTWKSFISRPFIQYLLEVREFSISRRAKFTPSSLPNVANSRDPGVRRSEVAALAGHEHLVLIQTGTWRPWRHLRHRPRQDRPRSPTRRCRTGLPTSLTLAGSTSSGMRPRRRPRNAGHPSLQWVQARRVYALPVNAATPPANSGSLAERVSVRLEDSPRSRWC